MKKTYLSPFNQRQYMIQDNFELYYYEDINFKNVKVHTHNYYEFYFFVDGDISMTIKGKTYNLKHGDIILIPPHTPHFVSSHNPELPYRRFVLWVNSKFYKMAIDRSEEYRFIIENTKNNEQYIYPNDIILFNTIQTKLFNIIDENYSNNFGKNQKLILYIYDLLLDLNRMAYEQINPKNSHSNQNLHDHIISYIENHIEEELSLDSIADYFYVSKFHIAHTFKQKYGISVHKFITKRRLEICKNAIMNDFNITDVFNRYGFKDYSSFYRAFKKEYGLSPKEFKEIHKSNKN